MLLLRNETEWGVSHVASLDVMGLFFYVKLPVIDLSALHDRVTSGVNKRSDTIILLDSAL